ncbi:PP2C family protein-serine/threonine phosphatase [Streptomyces sp. VRA16 Mangrove soil]|uniref:PP2C family protein-serine/threonine phosphatase n=1 Tax=Streptomyces sp. VRA16 Mangrove soil TaxID=2817434 RepID=UPI001A9F879D|nr:PP2C family protein-serine/threonine phosphatase [Streptomyces sp. VRA16 Mangrove soil]MBO1330013.1 serine/threonine-protein phosphatase [Streptomyces sp. VRA16 Mangrove soil]
MDGTAQRAPLWLRCVPWAVMVAALILELSTPAEVRATPLLTLACVAAGVVLPLRGTLAVAAAALTLELLITVVRGTEHEGHEYVDALNVLVAGGVGVAANRLRGRYGSRLAAAREIAEAAQRAVLPTPPSRLAGAPVAVAYRAARGGTRVGGDFYAALATPWGVRFVVGDVRGKGLGAVGLVAILLGAFREAAVRVQDLAEVAARMDEAASLEAERRGGEEGREGFATAVLAELPAAAPDRLRLLSRGHPAPYVFAPDGAVRELPYGAPGLPLGLGPLVAGPDGTAVAEHPLPPGALVLLLTDGVTEARDRTGAFFDPARDLTGLPRAERATPGALLHTVAAAVADWSHGERDDDMALLAFGRTTGTGPAGAV